MVKIPQHIPSPRVKSQRLRPPSLFRKIAAKIDGTSNESFVVVIGDEGAVLSYIKNNRVERRLFTQKPDGQHTRAMLDLLASSPRAPIFVLLDVLDQQYIRQSFPPVSALSLNKIVNRRLERDLPAEDIKGALPLGRDTEGRREWQYMLIAVSNTPDLQAWFELLLECENPFKGAYLVPIEGMNLMRDLRNAARLPKEKAPWQILFIHTKVGGFRQIVLHEGKLVFTRLSQVTDESNNAFIAGSVEQEIQNTLDYLRRFDLDNNQKVETYVIIAPDVKEQVDMDRFGFASYLLFSPYEAGEDLRLSNAALSADTYSDIILAHGFLKHAPIKRLIPHIATRTVKLEQTIRAVRWATAAAIILLLFLSAQMFWGHFTKSSMLHEVQVNHQKLQSKLNKLSQVVEGQAENVKLANSVTALWNTKKLGDIQPLDFVKELAEHLTNDVLISSIEWKKITIDPRISRVTGPSDLEVKVGVEFIGAYADDVAYANAANALYNKLRTGMVRYAIDAAGLPGSAGGTAQLEIDFDRSKVSAAKEKKRTALFTFRGFLPKTTGR